MDHLVGTWRKVIDIEDGVAARTVFHRPDPDCPCELLLTRSTEQAGAAYGVRIVSNSRLCEVYSKGPGEGAPSYVGTLQGEKEAGVEVAFAHCHQTERPILPGTTLTLQLRPLAPSKDILLLHCLEWLHQPAPSHPASPALEAAEAQAKELAEGSSFDLLEPASRAVAGAAAPAAYAALAADQYQCDRGSEQAKQEQHDAAATPAGTSRPQSLEPTQRQQRGQPGAGDGGGGSQMDEIRSLLRSVASQGAPGGNPRQALLAAVARSALEAPSGTTSLGPLDMSALGISAPAAAAAAAAAAGEEPAVPGAGGAGPSWQGGGAGGAGAGLPAFVAALMQATSLAGGTTAQGKPRQALAPAAAQRAGHAAKAGSNSSSINSGVGSGRARPSTNSPGVQPYPSSASTCAEQGYAAGHLLQPEPASGPPPTGNGRQHQQLATAEPLFPGTGAHVAGASPHAPPAVWPTLLQPGVLAGGGKPTLPSPQDSPPAGTVSPEIPPGGTAVPVAAMHWLSGELAQLEQRLTSRLEAGLCQLEARLCRSIRDTPGILGHQGLGDAAGAALPGGVAEPAARGAAGPLEPARVLPGHWQDGTAASCLTSSTAGCSHPTSTSHVSRCDSDKAGIPEGVVGEGLVASLGGSLAVGQAASEPAWGGRLGSPQEVVAAAELPQALEASSLASVQEVLEPALTAGSPGEKAAAAELPPALEGRLECLEERVAAVEELCRQILRCVQHAGVPNGALRD